MNFKTLKRELDKKLEVMSKDDFDKMYEQQAAGAEDHASTMLLMESGGAND